MEIGRKGNTVVSIVSVEKFPEYSSDRALQKGRGRSEQRGHFSLCISDCHTLQEEKINTLRHKIRNTSTFKN